jgi:DNA polymerase III epsilon subunit-like protein
VSIQCLSTQAQQVAIIDFEASCLPEAGESYPIEVALAKVDGSTRSWLIRPSPDWLFWDWSSEAEQLHGITREMLLQHGQHPDEVLQELVAEAGDCAIYADCDLDAYWLETLAQACDRAPPFTVRYLGELLCAEGASRGDVVSALERAKLLLPAEHVARDDASRLALALRLLAVSRRH